MASAKRTKRLIVTPASAKEIRDSLKLTAEDRAVVAKVQRKRKRTQSSGNRPAHAS